MTEWRVKIRKIMNDQDTDANQKAIDSLLNYETVKYFSAEEREAKRYDGAIKQYEKAALTTAYSLAFLNFGQSLIITGGLIIVMVMAALGVQSGYLTVGDFVMVNAYICLLYTSDAADDTPCVDLGGRRIIKKNCVLRHHTNRTV